jgi:hypothetical protein
VYNNPKSRTSWGPHGEDAWYINHAPEHWRCYKFYIPETKGFRISGAAKFFPSHCKMPTVDPADTIRMAAQDLVIALQNPTLNAPINLNPMHNQALRNLSNIFQEATPTSEGEDQPPRVDVSPSTSFDATAPRVVRLAPRVHQRTTRANKPFLPVLQEVTTNQRTNPSKSTKRFQAAVEKRVTRAAAREQEEQAIKQAIKENIQNINTSRLKKIVEEQRRVLITPVGTSAENSNDGDRPIPITQECDNVIEIEPTITSTSQTKKQETIRIMAPKPFHADALYHVVGRHIETYSSAYVPDEFKENIGHINVQVPLEEIAGAGVVNPETGETLTKSEQLLKVPALKATWSAAMCKELGHLATGWEGEQGTETIEFMSIDEIKAIPKDRTVTYARIVVDYRPQK